MNEIISSEMNKYGISNFLNSSQKYTENLFPEISLDKLFTTCLTGNIFGLLRNNSLSKIFIKEVRTTIGLMSSIMIIIIIHTIFKAIIEGLKNSETSKIAYFLQYLLIVSLVIESFVTILDLTKETINNIINFMNSLIPLMITLMLTTGSITTTSIFQPILIFLTSFIGNFIDNFIIPILMISIVLSIISNVSDKIQIDKLSKSFRSFIIWILGISLTLFTCMLSLEGTLSSGVDGIASKTTKAAVSSLIPVVGKIMGDAVDSIIGCTNILKNSLGVIGIIIIVGITVIPTVKILVMWFSFKIMSAVCEPISDEKIVKLMEQIADSYKIMLAILISVSTMFIISLALVIKITNSVLMYR